jgi:predicted 3-demethylubiquinone-9 3-methyltransferase (glyoxalase superfamily)
MNEMMSHGNKRQIDRVTQEFLKMKKFDIATLRKAYEEK